MTPAPPTPAPSREPVPTRTESSTKSVYSRGKMFSHIASQRLYDAYTQSRRVPLAPETPE